MWLEAQGHFSVALRDPDLSPPVPGRGFDVYRNNVAVSLKAALGDTFPVTKTLVGEEFFDAMAGVYWRQSPPASPVLAEWGLDFPDFIQAFEPAQSLPYLSDLARLEWAWLGAYHALDAQSLGIELLAGLDEAALETTTLVLHPSLRLVSSAWPVVSIWQTHQSNDTNHGSLELPDQGEEALILRSGLEVTVDTADTGEAALMNALASQEPLAQALALLSETSDAAVALSGLFQRGAIIGTQPANRTREQQ